VRHKHPGCPRSRLLSTRRQLVHGFGALLGTSLTGCGSDAEPRTGASGGAGAGGLGGAGAGGGGAGAGTGGGLAGTGGAASGTGGAASGTGGAASGAGGSSGGGLGGSGGMGPMRKNAADRVMLGMTGIEISRLAMGSGTHGSGGASDQTRLGVPDFSKLLTYAYSQGITFFETADAYGAHPHLAEAIRQVGRNNVTILTKTAAETAEGVQADLERFRKELGIDTIDIVLLHNKTSATWTTECEGAMEALELAKQRGDIRAHGVSCHSLEALELAAVTPWVDVDLARINPMGVRMDADPATVISVLKTMKAAGKGVIGMKILGEGALASQLDMAIQHAVGLDCIDGFTIGFTSTAQLDEVAQKISVM
jgi:aryl-alcohol dehydrogenase-like predicted oxidoreductase